MPKSPEKSHLSKKEREKERGKEKGKEKETKPKMKVLVLEDEYNEVAKRALSQLGFVEAKVVKTIEELKNISEKFKPDLVILDINVPTKEGENATDQSKESKNIIKEKFGDVPIFYYTSQAHGPKWIYAGIGETPSDARYMEEILSKIAPKLDKELVEIGDKSKEENWQKIFVLIPLIAVDKLKIMKKLPNDLRKKVLSIIEENQPEVAEALKRYFESI